MLRISLLILCLLLAGSVQAQQPRDPVEPYDCRIAPAVIDLQNAQITYKQAVINAMAADQKVLADWWAAYVGQPVREEVTPPMVRPRR